MRHQSRFVFCLVALVALALRADETPPPVTIRVVDEESGKPVTQFSYDYYIASPDRHEFPSHKEKVETRTEDGIIRIPAPRRCRLSVSAAAPGHIRCGGEFIVLPDDLKRTFAVELSPGENPSRRTLRGVIVDAQSGKPIAGAQISPVITGYPMPVELVERDDAVKTGADGRFVLRGLDGFTQLTGLCIEHNDYHTYQFNLVGSAKDKADIGTTRLQLLPPGAPREAALTREERQRKLRIFGSVTDSQGKPVGPYRIVAAALPVPDWPLGYENEAKNVPAGKPWELPLVFDMESEDQVCWVWVMVASPGFASSVKVVPRENTDKPIELQLQRGFSLSGRIEGPAVAAGKAVVMLQPMYLFARNPPNGVGMRPDSPLCGIQVNRTSVEPNGTFSLSNLAPGTYILQVVAPGATPTERLITVRDKDLRLDSPLKMVPAGRIEGIMFDDEGRPEIMTSHEWVSPVALDPRIGEALWGKQRLDFDADNYMTDENGRFTIQNAPIGVNRLRFAYSEPPAIDYVANHDYLVRVLPDRATQVRIHVPEDSALCWKTPVEVTIGDGSREQMIAGACITNPDFFKPVEFGRPNFVRVSLAFESVANQAASCPDFWATGVDVPPEGGVGRRVLKDISPGKYRVCYTTLQDRCGLYDDSIRPPLSEALDVHSKSAEPLRFRLPAASVRVEYEHPTEDVKDYGEALLMAVREGGKVVRRESARYEATSWLGDPSLSPYLDFVPPGCYTLVGWREDFGWARSGPINVEEGKITDGGVLKFHPGGTLQGRIALPDVCAVPDRVVAVDETGLTIPVKSEWTRGGYKFAVRDLWPGKWTLKVLDRDHNVIVEKQAELKATETVEIE